MRGLPVPGLGRTRPFWDDVTPGPVDTQEDSPK